MSSNKGLPVARDGKTTPESHDSQLESHDPQVFRTPVVFFFNFCKGMTPRCPRHQRFANPNRPGRRWRVQTPWCPGHRRAVTLRTPGSQF